MRLKKFKLNFNHNLNDDNYTLYGKHTPEQEKLAEIRKGMMIRRMKSLIADQLPKKGN